MNTRSKRASSVALLLGFCVLAPPAPDGTLAVGDRQHIAWCYSGIAPGAPVAPVVVATYEGDVVVERTVAGAVGVERALTFSVRI